MSGWRNGWRNCGAAMSDTSLAMQLAVAPPSVLAGLTEAEADALLYDWQFWARPKQLPPPGDWRYWLLLAGRGFGKTRTLVEWARGQAQAMPGSRGHIVGPTAADVRDVLIEGESGVVNTAPPDFRPLYEPSKRRLTWPNGAQATLFSADEPDRLRGPQCHWAIADELGSWRYPLAWDMLMFGLRLGRDPRCAVATTPKPVAHLKELIGLPETVTTRGSTYENRANLAGAFFTQIIAKYEGTRLGRQELLAELLEDVPGALWTRGLLDGARITHPPALHAIAVAIDPAVTAHEGSAETGIIVGGVHGQREQAVGYVLEDVSLSAGPLDWARAAVAAYHRHEANVIVVETNNGGDLVTSNIRTIDPTVKIVEVRATRGKYLRAEPVASLYEQGRIRHVGFFAELEDQLCGWVPGEKSPDRLDALVWLFTHLMVTRRKIAGAF